MLEIQIPGDERWDPRNNVFVYDKPAVLRLEHSLLSLSKWESTPAAFYAHQKTRKNYYQIGNLSVFFCVGIAASLARREKHQAGLR